MNPVQALSDVATRVLFRTAEVTAVVDHGPDIRVVELAGDELAGAPWVPGDKVQVRIDGFATRTYTPTRWDGAAGTTTLVVFRHGRGPGSAWAEGLAAGDECRILGPRRSVRLDRLDGRPIFVGDETSFGLAVAWRTRCPDLTPAAELFEVGDPGRLGPALDALGLGGATLVARRSGDAHGLALGDRLVEAVRAHPEAPLCFTGRAQTIAPLRARLRSEGLARRPTQVKAYWDENRSGLD